MSQFLHLKDKFGNDLWFGNTGSVRLAAMAHIKDYTEHLQRLRDLELHPDDVIVVGYPKSGNNWTHHMTIMLCEDTTDLSHVYSESSFLFLDAIGGGLTAPPSGKPRIFLSHLPFWCLPRDVTEKKVKVVYLTRNPKDVFVSLWCHVSRVKQPLGYEGTWAQFFEVMLEQGYWYGDVFDYLKEWEKQIESHPEQPILQCAFEDTKQDTLGQVERLNRFLGTNRTRERCQAIVDTCQLSNMPETRKISEDTMRKTFLVKDECHANCLYRKGIVGDWKNWFTVAQNEQFDAVYKTKMAGYRGKFTYE